MDPVNLLILLKTHSQAKMAPDSHKMVCRLLAWPNAPAAFG
jgi:hypothetical protein